MSDIFDTVIQAGVDEYLDFGRIFYPELEIVYLLGCLRRGTYDDRPQARVRRHLMMIAPPGLGKTTAAYRILYHTTGAKDLGDLEFLPQTNVNENPLILNFGGQGITWEKMRGSVAMNGEVVAPLLQIANFYVAGELMSFLRHGDDAQNRMDVLNEMLEEGRITVSLIKLAGLPPGAVERAKEICKRLNVRFNPETAIFSYDVQGSSVSCTRPLTPEEEKLLEESGFLSRHAVRKWLPTDEQVRALWRHIQTAPVSPHMSTIHEFNKKAWKVNVLKVPYPPAALVQKVGDVYDRVYSALERELGVPASKLRTLRDVGDIAQLLTAHAYARLVSTWDTRNGWTVPTLTYEESDATWVCQYVEARMQQLYADYVAKYQGDAAADEDDFALRSFVKKTGQTTFKASDLVAYLSDGNVLKISRATAYRKLAKMVERGWLRQVRFGVYEAAVPAIS